MDTSQIKRFAVESRNILKQGVKNRITALGFNEKGEVEERNKPQRLQGNTLFMGQLYDENFYDKWTALYNRIQAKGIKEVCEEAAYTWFNRLMAIRIMEKNGFTEPVLAFDDDRFRIPRIVSNARAGQFSVDASDREKLSELLMDDTKTTEQFTLLITSFCHTNPVINNCFGGVSGYTEILLPTNILTEGGFVDMLNHTEFITDDDFKKSELIGWLYQFYISEKKDEVFASFKNKHKAEAVDIPAATQIFTPNWIVKYMVQNTIGRIYLDNNPDSELKENWKYLVEPSSPTPEDCIYKYGDPKELTMADLGCGSGHILNEGFDILYDIYIEEGYSRKQAVENIFKYNLTGVDLDTRAKQLATFALMMKACQKDDSFLDCHILPNVLDMPDADNPICIRYPILKQAHNLGSIMKMEAMADETNPLVLALTRKYAAVVMNPPYMGSGNMNAELSAYVQQNYTEGKADLATVFVQVMRERSITKGLYGFVIPPSWMFLGTFESLRKTLIKEQSIQSVLHLSRGVFGADFGAVTSVIKNLQNEKSTGTYFRLVERTFQEFEQDHLRQLFEMTLANHEFRFCFKDYTKEDPKLYHSEKGNKIYYPNVPQSKLKKIPGTPMGYWVSNSLISSFALDNRMDYYFDVKSGLSTGDNDLFIRRWYEVNVAKISLSNAIKIEDRFPFKWFPYSKGGGVQKWYGNNDLVVNYENNGETLRNKGLAVFRNESYYFKEGITWSGMTSSYVSYRWIPQGFIFDSNKGPMIFVRKNIPSLRYIIGFLNTKISNIITSILNPTVSTQIGDIVKIPLKIDTGKANYIEHISETNIFISKQDWDAHETSWDFQTNELLKIEDDEYHTFIDAYEDEIRERYGRIDGDGYLLEALVECYKEKWEENFHQLHTNEEELNRQFIDIYGLQDELTPDVPLDEITILQQGEISIENDD